jgi:hypothetical protein
MQKQDLLYNIKKFNCTEKEVCFIETLQLWNVLDCTKYINMQTSRYSRLTGADKQIITVKQILLHTRRQADR